MWTTTWVVKYDHGHKTWKTTDSRITNEMQAIAAFRKAEGSHEVYGVFSMSDKPLLAD